MKFPIAYYLVLLYVTVMFKPLIPLITDTFSHKFSEAWHIATVHSIYGANHLEKELSNTSSENANSKHQNSVSAEDQASVHVWSSESRCCIYCAGTGKDYASLKLYALRPGFIIKNFPPPKFS